MIVVVRKPLPRKGCSFEWCLFSCSEIGVAFALCVSLSCLLNSHVGCKRLQSFICPKATHRVGRLPSATSLVIVCHTNNSHHPTLVHFAQPAPAEFCTANLVFNRLAAVGAGRVPRCYSRYVCAASQRANSCVIKRKCVLPLCALVPLGKQLGRHPSTP